MSRGVPLTAINGGMTRLRVKGAARKDSLYQLTNAYVTAGNTIKPRAGTIRNTDLSLTAGAGNTKGLVAHQGALHVFSAQKVNVPAGYVDHVLSHPAVQQTYTPPFPSADPHYSGFTVPSLLHFEDGNGSTTPADSGISPVTWTAAGNAAESTAQAKFGSGSLSFTTAAVNCITTPLATSDARDIFTGDPDFTYEFWYRPASVAGGIVDYIAQYGTSDNIGSGIGFQLWANGATVTAGPLGGSAWFGTFGSASTLAANAWNHIAFCRDGNKLRLYVNGIQSGTAAVTSSPGSPVASAVVAVGCRRISSGGASTVYIDEARVTKGVCLYGSPFPPPGSALTTAAVIVWNVGSLLHFDDGNNSTAFTDQVSANTWTAAGAAKEVTAQFKLGSGSGQFITVPANYVKTILTAGTNLDISDGNCDYTVECFYYPTDISNVDHTILDFGHKNAGSTTTDTLFRLYQRNTDLDLFDQGGGGFNAAGAIPINNVWYHIAIVRRGNVQTMYVNGVQKATISTTINYAAMTTGGFYLMGADWNSGAPVNTLNGYIDELRVIKGLAVYLSNFTPPAAPFTAPGLTPIAILDIHFAAPFMGFLYVVAEFVSDGGSGLGTVFHYWLQTSGTWLANKLYQVGQIVSPTVPNGMSFRAERVSTPNPKWAASTLKAVNDKVEPTVPNGFLYTATAVDGSNPITGISEPIWPTVVSGVVFEESENTTTGEVAGPAPQPSLTTPSPGTGGKYTNPYNIFTARG